MAKSEEVRIRSAEAQAEIDALYEELEALVEAGETDKFNAKMAEISQLESGNEAEEKDEPELSPVEVLIEETQDLEPEVTVSAIDEPKEATIVTEPKVVKASELGITSPATKVVTPASLGITHEFVNVLDTFSLDTLRSYFVHIVDEGQDDSDKGGIFVPELSKPGQDRHFQDSGSVSRAIRGIAIAIAGGVDGNTVTSPSGSIHELRDGKCFGVTFRKQLNGDGTTTDIRVERPCKGHIAKGKDRKTGKFYTKTHDDGITPVELEACKHQEAVMAANGFFPTFSKKQWMDSLRGLFELAKVCGDDKAREWASGKQSVWEVNNQDAYEMRRAYAVTLETARQEGLMVDGRLPAVTAIADAKLPDGKTVATAVKELKGRRFVLRVQVSFEGEKKETNTKIVRNLTELATAIAPSFQMCRQDGSDLKVLAVVAR